METAKHKARGGSCRHCPRQGPGAAADPIRAPDPSAVISSSRCRGRRPVGGDGIPHVEQMRRRLALLSEDHVVDEPFRLTMVVDGASPRHRSSRVLAERPLLIPIRVRGERPVRVSNDHRTTIEVEQARWCFDLVLK